MSTRISCDCGHCSYTFNICTVCDQSICPTSSNNGVCSLCIEHRISVEKLCNFIEQNIYVLEYLENDRVKYYKYKNYLEYLRNIYNHIVNYDSIIYENEIYNYLCDSKLIYKLIEKSIKKLYYILINCDNFIYAE